MGKKQVFVYWTKYSIRSWGEISVFMSFSLMEQDMRLEAMGKGPACSGLVDSHRCQALSGRVSLEDNQWNYERIVVEIFQ